MLWPRLIIRELLSAKRFTILFTLNLSIGLLGFTVLDGFKRDFVQLLEGAAKDMLGGDLEISGRRDLTEEELKKADAILAQKQGKQYLRSFYSMAQSEQASSLIQVRSIQPGYPLYGYITLKNKGRVERITKDHLFDRPKVWIADTLALQLDVGPGDQLKIGTISFEVDDIMIDESDARWAGAAIAPRVYAGEPFINQADLIKPGSVVRYKHLYQLPQDADVASLKKSLYQAIPDPRIEVSTHLTSGQDNGRMLSYLTDYLGLVAITALALAGLGATFLFRSHLNHNRKNIGILLALGLEPFQVAMLYIGKLFILGFLAAGLSSLLTSLFLPLFSTILKDFMPLPFVPSIQGTTVLVAFGLATGFAVLISLPDLSKIYRLKPSGLFQEEQDLSLSKPSLGLDFLLMIPLLLFFYGLSTWQSKSFVVGTVFTGGLAGVTLILTTGSRFLLGRFEWLSQVSFPHHLAFRYLSRKRTEAVLAFLALSLGTCLINLVPLIQASLKEEIAAPADQEPPSFFIFDIQEDQRKPLLEMIQQKGLTPTMSPMIRSRLIAINDKPFEREERKAYTREAEQDQRMRNRGVNLSYREKLDDSESLVDGRVYQTKELPPEGEPYEIMLETRYAGRLGVDLNDILTFEIQGIPIKGKVVGLRKIKWNTFQPNFFIQFQPGAIDDAPKTYVASIPALPKAEKLSLQQEVVKALPNISMINVEKIVEKLLQVISQMSFILLTMAALSVVAGLLVLFSIANYQAQTRIKDANLLKILGMSFRQIQKTTVLEFLILSLSATVIGALVSIGLSLMLAYLAFDGLEVKGVVTPFLVAFGITAVALVLAYLANYRMLTRKPRLYLN